MSNEFYLLLGNCTFCGNLRSRASVHRVPTAYAKCRTKAHMYVRSPYCSLITKQDNCNSSCANYLAVAFSSQLSFCSPHAVRILNHRPTLSWRRAVHLCSGMSAHLISHLAILHFHVSHFKPLPSTDFNALYFHHKRAEWDPGTGTVKNTLRQNQPRIPCGHHGHSLWPLWFVSDMV